MTDITLNNEKLCSDWYEMCKSFYVNKNPDAQRVMTRFDNFSAQPFQDTHVININDNCNNFAGLENEIFRTLKPNDELMYKLVAVKNQARSDSHAVVAEQRRSKCQSMALKLSQNNMVFPTHVEIVRSLVEFMRCCDTDTGLLAYMGGGIWVLLQNQLLHLEHCMTWEVDIDLIFERKHSMQERFLEFMSHCCLLTSEPLRWEVRPYLSNLFINRLLRIMKKTFRKHNFSLQALDSRFVNSICCSSTATARSDCSGRHEDMATYLANNVLPCPLL